MRAEAGTTHPARAEAGTTHPIRAEAGTGDSMRAEAGTTHPIRAETGTIDPIREETGTTHPARAEAGTTHPISAETGTTHPISAETGTTHPARAEAGTTHPIRAEAGTTHPISAETGTIDPIREETGTGDSMREETDTSATFREETGKTDPMRDKTKKNSHKTPTSLVQFEPQDIYEQSKPTTLSDSLSMVYHSMQTLHGKRKLSSSVHETYGKSKILKLTDVSTISCDIVSRSLWNDFCITTECTDVEHVSCKTAECDTSPKQAAAIFPSETAGTKNDGERKANTVAENDAKKDTSNGPDTYTVAKNDTGKHNTDIRIVIYPEREVITVAKTDIARGTNTGTKTDTVRGTNTGTKTDTARATDTANKTDSVKGTHYVTMSDTARGTNTVGKTDSVRGTNTLAKADSARGKYSYNKTDSVRGTHSVNRTDAARVTDSANKSDSARGTNSVTKTDSVRGTNSATKTDSVRGTNIVAKTDSVRGTNTVTKTDSVRGTNTVAKTDSVRGTNTVTKTDSVRGTNTMGKKDHVKGTNTVAKTDSAREKKSGNKQDSVRGTISVAKTDSVRGTNTVSMTDSVRGTNTVAKTDSVRGTNTVAMSDTARGTNTANKTDSVRGTNIVAKTDSVRGTTVTKTDSVRGTNTVAKTDTSRGTNTVAKTDTARGTNTVSKSDSVRGTNTMGKTDNVRGTNTMGKTDSVRGTNTVAKTDSVRRTNSANKTDTARGTNIVSKSDSVRGTISVVKTDSVRGTNSANKTDSVSGTNTVAKTDTARGTNTVSKTDTARGTNIVSKSDSVRGTISVAKTDSVRGTNSANKTDSVRGTNSAYKTDSVRGTNSVGLTHSVRGTNSANKTDSVRGTNTVNKTDSVRGTNSAYKTDSVRGTNTVAKTDTARGTNTVSKTDSIRGTISVAKTNSVRGTNSANKTDNVRGTNSANKTDSVRGTNSANKTDIIRGTNSANKTDSVRGTNTVNKTDSVRGTNTVNKTDSVRGTNTMNKTDSVRGTNSAYKTDSVRGTNSANKTDSVRGTDTVSKTDSVRGTNSANKTDSVRGTNSANKTDSVRGTNSANKTDSVRGTDTVSKTDSVRGTNSVAKSDTARGTNSCTKSDTARGTDTVVKTDSAGEIHALGRTDRVGSVTVANKGSKSAWENISGGSSQDLKSCKDPAICVQENTRQGNRNVMDIPTSAILVSSGLNKSFPISESSSDKTNCITSQRPSDLSQPLTGRNLLNMLLKETLFCRTTSVDLQTNVMSDISKNLGVAAAASLQNELLRPSTTASSLTEVKKDASRAAVTHGPERPQDLKKDHRVRQILATIQNYETKVKTEPLEYLLPSPPKGAFPEKNVSDLSASPLTIAVNSQLTIKGETSLPTTTVNVAQDLSEINSYSVSHGCSPTPNLKTEVSASSVNMGQMYDSNDTLNMQNTTSYAQNRRIQDGKEPSGSAFSELYKQSCAASRWDQQSRVTNAKGSPLVPNLKTPSSLPDSELYKQLCAASRWDQQSCVTNANGSPLLPNLKTPSAPVSKLNNQPSALGYSAWHTFDNQATKVFSVSNSPILTSTAPMVSSSQKCKPKSIMIPRTNSPIRTSSTAPMISPSQKSMPNSIMIPWSNSPILTSSTAPVMSSSQKCMPNPIMIPWSNSPILTSSTAPVMSSSQQSISNALQQSASATNLSGDSSSVTNMNTLPGTDFYFKALSTIPVLSTVTQSSSVSNIQTYSTGETSCFSNMNTSPMSSLTFQTLPPVQLLLSTLQTVPAPNPSGPSGKPPQMSPSRRLPSIATLLPNPLPLMSCHMSNPEHSSVDMAKSQLRLSLLQTQLNSPMSVIGPQALNVMPHTVENPCPNQPNSPMSLIGPHALNVISGSVENPCPNQANSPMSVIGPHTLNVIPGTVENPCPNKANSPMSVIGPHTLNVIPGTVENPCPNQANSPMSVIGPHTLNVMPRTVENPCPNQPNSLMSVIGPHTLNVMSHTVGNPCPNQPNSLMSVIGPQALNEIPGTVENPCPNHPDNFGAVKQQMSGNVNDQPLLTSSLSSTNRDQINTSENGKVRFTIKRHHKSLDQNSWNVGGAFPSHQGGLSHMCTGQKCLEKGITTEAGKRLLMGKRCQDRSFRKTKTLSETFSLSEELKAKSYTQKADVDLNILEGVSNKPEVKVEIEDSSSHDVFAKVGTASELLIQPGVSSELLSQEKVIDDKVSVSAQESPPTIIWDKDVSDHQGPPSKQNEMTFSHKISFPASASVAPKQTESDLCSPVKQGTVSRERFPGTFSANVRVASLKQRDRGSQGSDVSTLLKPGLDYNSWAASLLKHPGAPTSIGNDVSSLLNVTSTSPPSREQDSLSAASQRPTAGSAGEPASRGCSLSQQHQMSDETGELTSTYVQDISDSGSKIYNRCSLSHDGDNSAEIGPASERKNCGASKEVQNAGDKELSSRVKDSWLSSSHDVLDSFVVGSTKSQLECSLPSLQVDGTVEPTLPETLDGGQKHEHCPCEGDDTDASHETAENNTNSDDIETSSKWEYGESCARAQYRLSNNRRINRSAFEQMLVILYTNKKPGLIYVNNKDRKVPFASHVGGELGFSSPWVTVMKPDLDNQEMIDVETVIADEDLRQSEHEVDVQNAECLKVESSTSNTAVKSTQQMLQGKTVSNETKKRKRKSIDDLKKKRINKKYKSQQEDLYRSPCYNRKLASELPRRCSRSLTRRSGGREISSEEDSSREPCSVPIDSNQEFQRRRSTRLVIKDSISSQDNGCSCDSLIRQRRSRVHSCFACSRTDTHCTGNVKNITYPSNRSSGGHRRRSTRLIIKESIVEEWVRTTGTQLQKEEIAPNPLKDLPSDADGTPSQTRMFYVCGSTCGFSSLYGDELKMHASVCTLPGALDCHHCGFTASDGDALVAHVHNHSDRYGNLHECSVPNCEFETNVLHSYQTHVQEHHPLVTRHVCNDCKSVYSDIDGLIQHVHDNLLLIVWCKYCDAIACEEKVILDHIEKVHQKTLGTWTMNELLCGERKSVAKLVSQLHENPSAGVDSLPGSFTDGVETSDASVEDQDVDMREQGEWKPLLALCKELYFVTGGEPLLALFKELHLAV
ncbi:streptococcal hemagglutinin-like [Haliotis cracherodii]|uniref:streptococcal hemagglutinin-like n=1 Tax=Haliotis cracherodii TaxID=6455 RepID=UPI0039EB15F1